MTRTLLIALLAALPGALQAGSISFSKFLSYSETLDVPDVNVGPIQIERAVSFDPFDTSLGVLDNVTIDTDIYVDVFGVSVAGRASYDGFADVSNRQTSTFFDGVSVVGSLTNETGGNFGTSQNTVVLSEAEWFDMFDIVNVGFLGSLFYSGSAYAEVDFIYQTEITVTYNFTEPAPVPLPAGGALIVTAVAALGLMRRKAKQVG